MSKTNCRSSSSDITTAAPPTTPIASTLPMTTFGATTTAPITLPSTTLATGCEEGQEGCAGETEVFEDYNLETGKTTNLCFLFFVPTYDFIRVANLNTLK